MSVSDDQLYQLLRHTFGTRVKIVDQQRVNENHDYLVLVIHLRHPSLTITLKLAGPGANMASSFAQSATLNRLVAERTEIPMPEIMSVNMSFQNWPWRYLIQSYIPGQEWSSAQNHMTREEVSDAYRQIGNAIAQLHAIGFTTFGEFTEEGAVSGSSSFITAYQEHANRLIASPNLRHLYSCVIDQHVDLFADVQRACLCHEDLHKHNILFQYQDGQWRLATILDFEKAWSGHAEIDQARMEFWKGMTSPDFWKAYESIGPVDSGYIERRPIYQLLWCFEFARSTAKHLRDTQELCRRLGVVFPGRFDS